MPLNEKRGKKMATSSVMANFANKDPAEARAFAETLSEELT